MNNMEPIVKNIREKETQGMRIFSARTGARDVVSIEGSVLGGRNMLPRISRAAASLATELLDAGTKKRDKDSIRAALSARGISLSFSAGGDRTLFSAACLPEDLPVTLTIIAECLSEPKFPASELSLAQERAVSEFKEEKTDTRAQAAQSLSRLLYDPMNVNFVDTTAARQKCVASITRKDVVDFGTLFGRDGLILAVVGDIDPAIAIQAGEKAFGDLSSNKKSVVVLSKTNEKLISAAESLLPIPHKTSIDTFLGVSVPLTISDPRFQSFASLCDMLGGGGFTSHLMQTVRERDGLCYVINASPAGFTDNAEGYLRVYATFSPDTYEHSVNVLRKEIDVFFRKGITAEKLEGRKFETKSHYLIGLSTTRGLAGMLHKIGVENRLLSYIDEYPTIIDSLSVDSLKRAAELIQLDKLSLAAAGTFAK